MVCLQLKTLVENWNPDVPRTKTDKDNREFPPGTIVEHSVLAILFVTLATQCWPPNDVNVQHFKTQVLKNENYEISLV